jgi:hypothetical protein
MTDFQLLIADWFLNLLHFVIVVALCAGWVFQKTRFFHRILISVVTVCWVLIGPLTGHAIGYCPVTDWGWQVRKARGETDLEYGYINYLLEKGGIYLTDQQTDIVVGAVFVGIWVATLFLWLRDRRRVQT